MWPRHHRTDLEAEAAIERTRTSESRAKEADSARRQRGSDCQCDGENGDRDAATAAADDSTGLGAMARESAASREAEVGFGVHCPSSVMTGGDDESELAQVDVVASAFEMSPISELESEESPDETSEVDSDDDAALGVWCFPAALHSCGRAGDAGP